MGSTGPPTTVWLNIYFLPWLRSCFGGLLSLSIRISSGYFALLISNTCDLWAYKQDLLNVQFFPLFAFIALVCLLLFILGQVLMANFLCSFSLAKADGKDQENLGWVTSDQLLEVT